MSKIIAVHSFRGGTGKSFVASSLAMTCAIKKEDVCILDLDFRAPTLGAIFRDASPKYTLNDYFDGRCKVEDALVDMSKRYNTGGRLFVGFSSDSPIPMQKYMIKGRSWWLGALKSLSLLKQALNNSGIDYVFLDTSPGFAYSSINAVCIADAVLVVMSMDQSDVKGTRDMIESIYRPLDKKIFLLFEKYPAESGSSLTKAEIENIHKMFEPSGLSVLGAIPCSCDVLRSKGSGVFILENLNHPLNGILTELSENLFCAL